MIDKNYFDCCVKESLLETWRKSESTGFDLDEFGKHYETLRDWMDNLYIGIKELESKIEKSREKKQ